ncbi:hypothetical protein AOLI_G00020570 [Acnodon oligacanthus]
MIAWRPAPETELLSQKNANMKSFPKQSRSRVQDGVRVMNKPENPSESKSSGAPRKSSHAKDRRHKKETQNVNEGNLQYSID